MIRLRSTLTGAKRRSAEKLRARAAAGFERARVRSALLASTPRRNLRREFSDTPGFFICLELREILRTSTYLRHHRLHPCGGSPSAWNSDSNWFADTPALAAWSFNFKLKRGLEMSPGHASRR